MLNPLKSIAAIIKGARGNLDEIRGQIDALRVEREDIASAPLAEDDALTLLDENIARLGEKFAAEFQIGSLLYQPDRDSGLERMLGWHRALVFPGTGEVEIFAVGPALLAWVAPDLLKGQLVGLMRRAWERRPAGLPAGERRRRLAEIDAQVLALEHREERLICEMEAEGLSVERRPDLDPRAFAEVMDRSAPAPRP